MTLHNENSRENFEQVNFIEIQDKGRKRVRNWNVVPSQFSLNTLNPIRAIVEHLKIEPNPEKAFIPLSVGEYLVFVENFDDKNKIKNEGYLLRFKFNGSTPHTNHEAS